ncbi:MAG: hypothetical protein GY752_01220, partial [bacterium]|nr:hypothetical protein [bacterium]
KYIMAPKAAGATEEQFIQKGWSRKDLIAEEYLILNPATAPKPNTSGWPQQNEENEWLDSEGTVFDENMHAMTKSKVPGVTVKGVFKKRRGYKPEDPSVAPVQKEPAVAPPPTSTEAPAAPSAPSAPTAPSAPSAGDEPLDEELDSLIKNWE